MLAGPSQPSKSLQANAAADCRSDACGIESGPVVVRLNGYPDNVSAAPEAQTRQNDGSREHLPCSPVASGARW